MLISSKIRSGINGNVLIPGDKSISHRSIILSSISKGLSEISNILWSDDVINTFNAFKSMGVNIEKNNNNLIINGKGLNSLKKPEHDIYLGNSGTSARLLIGLLSSQNFNSKLTGDKSLSNRPMKRIIDPLLLMGAKFKSNNDKLPLEIFGKELTNINYDLKLPSAQIKSGLMLAALNTSGKTIIKENNITRDHTEIMLKSLNANINIQKENSVNLIKIIGKTELKSKDISVPSDLSSASFFIIAALINAKSKIKMHNINLNPTRDGILRALSMMNAKITISNKRIRNGELIGNLLIESSELNGCNLDNDMSKFMIDEFPILSIAASFAKSPSIFRGLGELRIKESDRLELIRYNLDQCGIYCKIIGEDLHINPLKKHQPKGNIIKTNFDHRIAMSFAIMGTKLNNNLNIKNPECIQTSFPKFVDKLNNIGGNLIE